MMWTLIVALSALVLSIVGIVKEKTALAMAGQFLGVIALGLILTQLGLHG